MIQLVKQGWTDLRDLQLAAKRDVALENGPELERAVKRLKYGQLIAAISNATHISQQTVYSYGFGFKNEWNGWIRIGDFPEGHLVTFSDPGDFDRTEPEIYSRVSKLLRGRKAKHFPG
jgi:hypothetical protein